MNLPKNYYKWLFLLIFFGCSNIYPNHKSENFKKQLPIEVLRINYYNVLNNSDIANKTELTLINEGGNLIHYYDGGIKESISICNIATGFEYFQKSKKIVKQLKSEKGEILIEIDRNENSKSYIKLKKVTVQGTVSIIDNECVRNVLNNIKFYPTLNRVGYFSSIQQSRISILKIEELQYILKFLQSSGGAIVPIN